MMMDLPPSDQASLEGPTLTPIVGNNTGGGELVLSSQMISFSNPDHTRYFS